MDEFRQNPERRQLKVPLVMVIVTIGVVGLFTAGLFIKQSADVDSVELIDQPAPENSNTQPALTSQEREQATIRDAKRVADMKATQVALEAYRRAKDAYPAELTGLVPEYLREVPLNPTPGGADYSYTVIGGEPFTFYDLTYTLEVGSDGILAGDHSATPDGIATP
ncbi:MAG: hypothetical protein V1916_02860 [Patescibacteria group bacterium]